MQRSTKWLRPAAELLPAPVRGAAFIGLGLALTLALQGYDVPHVEGYLVTNSGVASSHRLAEWRGSGSYWEKNSYRDPETGEAAFNSCTNPKLSVVEVCGGHGHCAPFDVEDLGHPVLYCKCDDAYAGLECGVKRKHQSVAWFLSLVLGPLAADQIYLGWVFEAMVKLIIVIVGASIGSGLGVGIVLAAWMYDVVHIGMGPVLTPHYRVQEDLPRITFAVLTVLYFCMLAVFAGVASMYWTVIRRRREWDQMSSYGATKNVV